MDSSRLHGGFSHESEPNIETSDDSVAPENDTKPVAYVQYARANEQQKPTTSAIRLPRQVYILGLVIAYGTMFVVAWAILCITSRRPIGRSSYYCYDSGNSNECYYNERTRNEQNDRTLIYVADAQTILSAVSLLTIPLTSAVCAAAAVPWLQSSGRGMSLRQVMTLADKGWTSPYIYTRLLSPSGWKRYGSSFIALSLILNALGAALSPAISRLSAATSIKVPTATSTIHGLFSIDRLLTRNYGEKTLPLRDALRSGSAIEFQPRLWQHESLNCSDTDTSEHWEQLHKTPNECSFGGLTYQSLASVPNAWISQLPYDFNTGVIGGQCLPRVNSSVSAEKVAELPSICTDGSAALVINHEGQAPEDYGDGGTIVTHHWWIKACVPEYATSSPFKPTSNRQTITETLYLDMYSFDMMADDGRLNTTFKVTINTTLGYFQLPSYSNNDQPGPLLEHYAIPDPYKLRPREALEFTSEMNSTHKFPWIEAMQNKGPLLNTVYALFGNGSMPAIYASENSTYNVGYQGDFPTEGFEPPCVDIIPLAKIFRTIAPIDSDGYLITYGSECLSSYAIGMGVQMHTFIKSFCLPGIDMVGRVFRIAAYMSHSIWLQGDNGFLDIRHDKGIDLQKPGLSKGSITGLSLAISGFLITLLMLAFYASFSRTWTGSLDSYALLRIGADLGKESLPFLAVRDVDQIAELDDLPGWVGDEASGESHTGQLGLGYLRDAKNIDPRKKYEAYEHITRGRWWIYSRIDTACSLGGFRRTHASERCTRILKKASELLRRVGILAEDMTDKFDRMIVGSIESSRKE